MELLLIILFTLFLLTAIILQITRYHHLDQKSKEEEVKSKESIAKMELEKQKLNLELTEAYDKITKAEQKKHEDDNESKSILGIASDVLDEISKQ